jgi:hypothetical protein
VNAHHHRPLLIYAIYGWHFFVLNSGIRETVTRAAQASRGWAGMHSPCEIEAKHHLEYCKIMKYTINWSEIIPFLSRDMHYENANGATLAQYKLAFEGVTLAHEVGLDFQKESAEKRYSLS